MSGPISCRRRHQTCGRRHFTFRDAGTLRNNFDPQSGIYLGRKSHGAETSPPNLRPGILMLSEAPNHGSELIWEQAEFLPEEILRCVKEKADLSAFRSHVQAPDSREWYVCELVLVEVHDSCARGPRQHPGKGGVLGGPMIR